ncbi:TPA: hypothetical protein MA206_005590 [Klebsiella pneumoniae]|nr:hypothetical protein [Escherichia coli]HBT0953991.1 hypothetical protein [Klebsiella pneumoniae]HBT0998680.1 hypothetical protein [Klebsiella pneumoniae]
MLIKIIKSVFNFYILCVQPLLGLFLVGYSVWRFSDKGICTADKVLDMKKITEESMRKLPKSDQQNIKLKLDEIDSRKP